MPCWESYSKKIFKYTEQKSQPKTSTQHKNIIYIFLCILVISFSINCQIHIYQNTDQDLSENILDRFNLFNEIHVDGFWNWKDRLRNGEHYNHSPKQKALKGEIDSLVKDQTFLKSFLKKAFVVSSESDTTVLDSLALRVPVYDDTITYNKFMQEPLKQFRTLLYPNYKYPDEITIFNKSHIVLPAGVTPYWSWDANELRKQGEIGIVFSNGFNLESIEMCNYHNFNEEDKKKELQEFIDNLALCLVTAAYKLTKDQGKEVCQLKIPVFEWTVSKDYSERVSHPDLHIIEDELRTNLAKLHVNAIYDALKKDKFNDLKWYVEFFTITDHDYYDCVCEEIINNNILTNIKYSDMNYLFNKDTCYFNENYMKQNANNNYFTVFACTCGPHSFLGNGGYNSGDKCEKRLIGRVFNDDYLNAIHLLNLFLPDIAFSKNQQQELTILCNKEKKGKLMKRTLIILGYIMMTGIILFLVKKFIIDIDESSRIKHAYKL